MNESVKFITSPKGEYLKKITKLWCKTFGDDEAFVSSIIASKSYAGTVCAENNGELIGMAHLIKLENKSRAYYLYAVATAAVRKAENKTEFLELMKKFPLERFRGYARETDSIYITHYDYENVINNKIRGEHMFPMEQVIMIILWHKVVKAPNDIFEFPMDKIDLNAKTIECFDGEIAHLSDKEVAIIREFKEQQNTRVYVNTAKGKVSGYYGIIEMEEDDGEVTTVYVGSDSKYLIHSAYGTSYTRENGIVVDVVKAAPIQWCFGKRRMLKIQESLSRKLDIHFTPFNIVRSRKYHDMIVGEGLTLFNLEQKFKITRAKKFGINSASIKEVQDILEREAKQELQQKDQKD